MRLSMKILVSGASGIVGYGILRSLKSKKYKLIATTIYELSAANCFADYFELAPKTSDKIYINWINNIINKYDIDIIIPGIEDDVFFWNDKRDILMKSGAYLLLNNADLINLCFDKWIFYKVLEEHNSPYRITSAINGDYAWLVENFGLPFLLKPRRGYASRGIVRIETESDFAAYKNDFGPLLMAQPIVGGAEEYTVSGFFDKNSELCCFQALKRSLSKEGFTELAEVVYLIDIKPVLLDLAEIFRPVGPTNFQFKLHEGQYKLLEINPRISSSTSIRSAFGYNESVMSVEYFLNGKIPIQPLIKGGRAVRYVEDFIFMMV